MNKVKFGLRNCYYAKATMGASGDITFGTPVAMPGAVSLSLDPEGESENFYADVSRGEAGHPGFPRLVQVTSGGFSLWL